MYSLDGNQHGQIDGNAGSLRQFARRAISFASEAAQMPENQFCDKVTAPEFEVFNANDEKAISLWRNNDGGRSQAKDYHGD